MLRPIFSAILVTIAIVPPIRMFAQAELLDDFSTGNIVVSNSVNSSFGNPVPAVFGGNRTILLTKVVESSATSVTVGSSVLTWSGTAQADYGWVGYGTATTRRDMSAYNAFRVRVVSTPQNPGRLQVDVSYYGSPTHIYGVHALATLPVSGTVDIPFSSFIPNPGFPPIDFTQVHSIALAFRGNLLSPGAYVLDDFQAVLVPDFSFSNLVGHVIYFDQTLSGRGIGTATFDAQYTYFSSGDPREPYIYERVGTNSFRITNFDPENPTVPWSHLLFAFTNVNSGTIYDEDEGRLKGIFRLFLPSRPTLDILQQPPANAVIGVSCREGQIIVLEHSTNLLAWSSIATNIAWTGRWTVSRSTPATAKTFFRAYVPTQ